MDENEFFQRTVDEMITSKVKKITEKSERKVYDIVGMPNGNFVCNRAVIKNCDEAIRFAAACLDGNTLIKTPEGLIKIKDLNNLEDFPVYSYNKKTKKEEIQVAERCVFMGNKEVFEIELDNGRKIMATETHQFLTQNGWKFLGDLNESDEIINVKEEKIKWK